MKQNERIDVYLAGPITGLPNYNREAFRKAEVFLQSQGLTVYNPNHIEVHTEVYQQEQARNYQAASAVLSVLSSGMGGYFQTLQRGYLHLGDADAAIWEHAMRESVAALLRCSSMVLLPGWRASHGTRTEVELATALQMTIFELQ